MRLNAFAGLLVIFLSAGHSDDPPQVIDLWPGPAHGDVGIPGEERFFELKVGGKPYEIAGRPTRWLTNVSKPTITVYRPAMGKDTGVSMIICPAVGYHKLGWGVEGTEVAEWLTSIGVTGILLKYRCPRRRGDVMGEPPLGPLKDAQRAVSMVRSKAREWGIVPQKIGMVGFSAGGHLVGATATRALLLRVATASGCARTPLAALALPAAVWAGAMLGQAAPEAPPPPLPRATAGSPRKLHMRRLLAWR